MVTTSSSTTLLSFRPPASSTTQQTFTPLQLSMLSAVLEGFIDGVLILAQDGTCLHANQQAKALCRHLNPRSSYSNEAVPDCLWTLCGHLLDGQDWFPGQAFVLTQNLTCPGGQPIRVRVQWLNWPDSCDRYFLVLLEDQTRSAQATALLEAMQYDLTPRERDVWALRRTNHSYEDIALELHITVNTVKRHLKSIYAKRKQVLEDTVN